MPDCSGEPVVTTSCAFSFLHARPRVQRAPGIPCALSIRAVDAKLGRTAPRERGGVTGSTAVIARQTRSVCARERERRSDPALRRGRMDCFAALALTASAVRVRGCLKFQRVMAGLVPAIHVLCCRSKDVDARHKAGHDEW